MQEDEIDQVFARVMMSDDCSSGVPENPPRPETSEQVECWRVGEGDGTPPSAVGAEWFVASSSRKGAIARSNGPFSVATLQAMFENGELAPMTLVWQTGAPQWRPLCRIPEIVQALSPRLQLVASELSSNEPDAPSFRPQAADAMLRAVREVPPVPFDRLRVNGDRIDMHENALGANRAPLGLSDVEALPERHRSSNTVIALTAGLVGVVTGAALTLLAVRVGREQLPVVIPAAGQTAVAAVVSPPSPTPAKAADRPKPERRPVRPASVPPASAKEAPAEIVFEAPSPRRQADRAAFEETFGATPPSKPATSATGVKEDDDLPELLGQSDIAEMVLKHRGSVETCAKAQREVTPDQAGQVVMRWLVFADGSVEGVKPVDSSDAGPMASCLAAQIARWRFPKRRNSTGEVTFPFTF